MSAARPGPLRVFLLTALLCLIWGSTWVVIQEGLKDLPPFQSAAARFLLAALLMIIAVTVQTLSKYSPAKRKQR